MEAFLDGKVVPAIWKQVFRVLKPGGHVAAFFGTRTYDLGVLAIRLAGFEVRDCVQWVFGSGFPKSLDVSKAIDKAAGAEREKVGVSADAPAYQRSIGNHRPRMDDPDHKRDGPIPATAAAAAWDGWGTALKPACEPIVLARKPLIGTVAENILRHGTGALNIDGCRVEAAPGDKGDWPITQRRHDDLTFTLPPTPTDQSKGRWPANICHDGSEEVLAAFPETTSGTFNGHRNKPKTKSVYGQFELQDERGHVGDSGSAARFFYTPKADNLDRLGSQHPTVKPLDLMQWLVRLVCPPGGTVLDCFAGTGTTGEAAFREGMRAVLIEREPEYQEDIRRRMALVMSGPEERSRASVKQKMKDKPVDHGPLFGGSDTSPIRIRPAGLKN